MVHSVEEKGASDVSGENFSKNLQQLPLPDKHIKKAIRGLFSGIGEKICNFFRLSKSAAEKLHTASPALLSIKESNITYKISKAVPNFMLTSYFKGKLAEKKGDIALAISLYKKSITEDKSKSKAIARLEKIAEEKNHSEEVKKVRIFLAEIYETDVSFGRDFTKVKRYADLLFDTGNTKEAAQIYKKLINSTKPFTDSTLLKILQKSFDCLFLLEQNGFKTSFEESILNACASRDFIGKDILEQNYYSQALKSQDKPTKLKSLGEKGNRYALYKLGEEETELAKSIEYFRKALFAGNEKALQKLDEILKGNIDKTLKDRIYETFGDFSKNIKEKLEYYQYVDSQQSLYKAGHLCEEEAGKATLPKERWKWYKRAFDFYEKASEKGSMEALFAMGKIYEEGKFPVKSFSSDPEACEFTYGYPLAMECYNQVIFTLSSSSQKTLEERSILEQAQKGLERMRQKLNKNPKSI